MAKRQDILRRGESFDDDNSFNAWGREWYFRMTCRFHITLVRHGETMENRENIIQGQSDTQLSDLGRQQASLVAARLRHEHFTHMYSSDLSRAADTAKAIASANEVSTCELVLDKQLRERSFGIMEGKKFSELQTLMKELCLTPQIYTPENGERIEQVSKRALQFFKDLCEMVVSKPEDLVADRSPSLLEDAHENSAGENSNQSPMATPSSSSHLRRLADGAAETVTVSVGNHTSDKTSNGVESKLESIDPSNSSPKDVEKNILIVSHGLLMKELKRLILDRYHGKLIGDTASQNQRFSPNTGVSKFTLSACKIGKKIRVACTDCPLINCSEHLRSSNLNLVTEAKYQDAV